MAFYTPEGQIVYPPYWQPIPGLTTRDKPGYYNVLTGATMSEYHYRRYRKGLSYKIDTTGGMVPNEEQYVEMPPATQAELEEHAAFRQERSVQKRAETISRQQEYAVSQNMTAEESRGVFNLLNQMRVYHEYNKNNIRRTYGKDSAEYEAYVAPDGSFAQVLVALGLRPPDATWNVGESDAQPGWSNRTRG